MKSLIKAVALAAVLAVPALSFAQSNPNQPITRAEVRSELVQLEKAGYSPFDSSDAHYPAQVQQAEARVSASNDVTQNGGYGSATTGTSDAGHRDITLSTYSPPIYQHH
jgi:hypothetical protein